MRRIRLFHVSNLSALFHRFCGILPQCRCQSEFHLLTACRAPHQPSIARAVCTSILARLRKSWSVALRRIHLSGSRLPVICTCFLWHADAARSVQAHSRPASPNPFFQEREKTLVPRWNHTPSASHARFFSPEPDGLFPAGDLPPLAQRLERRKQPSLPLHGTVDSWDFPTTLLAPSPIQSVFRRLRHSTSLDDKCGKKKEDSGPNEQVADGAQPNKFNAATSEHETMLTSATTFSPSNAGESRPSLPINRTSRKAPSGVGHGATSGQQTWASPTIPATPSSVSASSNQTSSSPSPSPSLWRRIRRSTGHSDDGAWLRSTFIDSVLQRGKGGP